MSLLRITTPFALISTHSTHFELVHALKLTKATRIFVDPKLLKNVLDAIEDPDVHITSDKVYIMSGPSVHGRKSFSQMVATIKRRRVTVEPVRPATVRTLAYLVMSSGTSGLPKGLSGYRHAVPGSRKSSCDDYARKHHMLDVPRDNDQLLGTFLSLVCPSASDKCTPEQQRTDEWRAARDHAARGHLPAAHVPHVRSTLLHPAIDLVPDDLCHPGKLEHDTIPQGH